MKIVLALIPLLFAAAPPSPAPVAGGGAVNGSVLQTFTKEGFRAMRLTASTMDATRTRVDMTEMNLSIFTGDANEHIETILLSPAATFFPETTVAQGENSVRFIRDDLEATGKKWTYDNKSKRISLDQNVRVVFHADLKDILK